jgi:CBS domain-containing protein
MSEHPRPDLRREDFQKALQELDSYIDVTLDDLMQINRSAEKHSQLRNAEQLQLRDIMTKNVVTVSPDSTLRNAASILLELRISGLPVVDAENQAVGIVTEADFLSAMGLPTHPPAQSVWQTLEAMFTHPSLNGRMPATVADIMSTQLITMHENQTLHEAIAIMKKHDIKRVVVVNQQQQVRGIITRSNLIRVLLQRIL